MGLFDLEPKISLPLVTNRGLNPVTPTVTPRDNPVTHPVTAVTPRDTPRDGVCAGCSTHFVPKNAQQLFCTPECGAVDRQRRHRDRTVKTINWDAVREGTGSVILH